MRRKNRMNADDVSRLVTKQIAGRSSLPNLHGVDMSRCHLTPRPIQVIDRSVLNGKLKDSQEQVWLVLEERPTEKDGYKIVFSERRGAFGLASPGFATDQHPILCGWYGDFPTTLAAM
jgi:hypothetical protein